MVGGVNHTFSRRTIVRCLFRKKKRISRVAKDKLTQHVKSKDPNVHPEMYPHYLEATVGTNILPRE